MSKNRQARRREAARQKRQQSASRPEPQALSLSRGLQAVNACDPFHGLRSVLSEVSQMKEEWAGIPMPLEGERLIIEPTYPYAEALSTMTAKPREGDDDDGWRERNRWYSDRHRADIIVMEKDGKVDWGKLPAFHHFGLDLSTLGCSEAWGIEQEGRAVQLLGRMLRHRQFKQYLLTGMFPEKSARSGVLYIFRKLKPTVAVASNAAAVNGQPKILASLCMHPIAYYAGSWAGAMCPTDDVIAHLALMRGDEHMFWKRCNQHPPYRPEAGL